MSLPIKDVHVDSHVASTKLYFNTNFYILSSEFNLAKIAFDHMKFRGLTFLIQSREIWRTTNCTFFNTKSSIKRKEHNIWIMFVGLTRPSFNANIIKQKKAKREGRKRERDYGKCLRSHLTLTRHDIDEIPNARRKC